MESNIQKYIAFETTVMTGSFTEAAKRLHYSQSGVSRMVSDLENEWGISLLERRKAGVRLTGDGEKIYPYVKSLCQEYERLQMQIDEINGLQSGLIRIGTFSSAAQLWIPKIIKSFQGAYPNVDYTVVLGDYSEIERWILDGTIDCGFLPLPVDESLESIFIERNQLMAVLPKDHPMAASEKFPLSSLADEPLMLLEEGNAAEVTAVLDGLGLEPRINFKTWDDYAIMAMVEQGLGISILTEQIMQRCPYDIIAKSFDTPIFRDVALVYRKKETSSLAFRRFLEYLPAMHDGSDAR